jgi:hypothetical protein
MCVYLSRYDNEEKSYLKDLTKMPALKGGAMSENKKEIVRQAEYLNALTSQILELSKTNDDDEAYLKHCLEKICCLTHTIPSAATQLRILIRHDYK